MCSERQALRDSTRAIANLSRTERPPNERAPRCSAIKFAVATRLFPATSPLSPAHCSFCPPCVALIVLLRHCFLDCPYIVTSTSTLVLQSDRYRCAIESSCVRMREEKSKCNNRIILCVRVGLFLRE